MTSDLNQSQQLQWREEGQLSHQEWGRQREGGAASAPSRSGGRRGGGGGGKRV